MYIHNYGTPCHHLLEELSGLRSCSGREQLRAWPLPHVTTSGLGKPAHHEPSILSSCLPCCTIPHALPHSCYEACVSLNITLYAMNDLLRAVWVEPGLV